MRIQSRTAAAAVAGTILFAGLASAAYTQTARTGGVRTMHASGPFEVKLKPEETSEVAKGTALGRMSIDKRFRGGLEATSKGEMLAVQTSVKGSAGYVAIEQVSGTLDGRAGTFVLQHNGTMSRGEPRMEISVVPDSGTGDLAGITGTMTIDFTPDGEHSYRFDYTLPGAR